MSAIQSCHFPFKLVKMKKIIFSIVVLSFLTAFTTTKVMAVTGFVDFGFTLNDPLWGSQSYDMYVMVVADGQSTGWQLFDVVPSPGNYYTPLYNIYMTNLPYPAPIT